MNNDQQKRNISFPTVCTMCEGAFISQVVVQVCDKCREKNQVIQNKITLNDSLPILQKPSTFDTETIIDKKNQKNDAIEEGKRILEKYEELKQIYDPLRCKICNKKTGIYGYECKHCTMKYCKFHRLPEEHECQVDFISLGRKKIKMQNPLIASLKIQPI